MPPATQPKKKSIYGVHPGVLMTQKWITELKQKTGRSLEEWITHIKKAGPKDEKARREWLKTEHGLGTNSAWWLAERSRLQIRQKGFLDATALCRGGSRLRLQEKQDGILRMPRPRAVESHACLLISATDSLNNRQHM